MGDRVRLSWVQGMWSLGGPRVSIEGVWLVSLDTRVHGVVGWLVTRCVGVGLAVGSQVVATPGLEGVVVGLFLVLWEVGVHSMILVLPLAAWELLLYMRSESWLKDCDASTRGLASVSPSVCSSMKMFLDRVRLAIGESRMRTFRPRSCFT